jgi:amino acid transporter
MNLIIAIVIVAVVTSASIVAMLLVRRRAPDGSYFNDGDRAAGVFGVLATGFSVLLGFVVFLAFTTYDVARAGAEEEARIVTQQVETAQLFSPEVADELTEGLVCYARSVVGVQWDQMDAGTLGDELNPWVVALYRTFQAIDPQTPSEQAAYSKWLDERTAREEARGDRVHGAIGVIPDPLWIVLFFTSVVIFVFMLFFADSGEGVVVQAMLMGSVVAVIVAMLLLLVFLDNPYHDGVGGLRPESMQRALVAIDQELSVIGREIQPPCDSRGNPL